MKRSPIRRKTPLRRSFDWYQEVGRLPAQLKRKTPLKPRRKEPRKDGPHRDRAHLDKVKALGYCSAAHILGVTGCWMSMIDPDHMGEKPGKNIKCGDHLTAPMCRRCHSWRTDGQGVFKGWSHEKMSFFTSQAIELATYYLNAEAMGGHGRRRAS